MEHGSSPTIKHCTCVVNLLGRVVRLANGKAFIRDFVFHDEPMGWCGRGQCQDAGVMNNTNKMDVTIR
jgi:hypothetical protein